MFEARGRRARSAEERASEAAGRERIIAPLRYGRECGLVLIAAGLLGTVWQFWD